MKRLFFILAIISIILLVSNVHLLNIRKNENQIAQFNWATENTSKSDILLLGDSFAAYSVLNNNDCEILNFAYPGDHFGDCLFKLRAFLKSNKPKHLLLQMNSHLFKKDPSQPSAKYNLILNENQSDLLSYFPIANTQNRYEYGQIILKKSKQLFQGKSEQSIYLDSTMSLKRTEQYNWAKTVNKEKELHEITSLFYSKALKIAQNKLYLDSIHSICLENNIKVHWVYFPTTKEYFDKANEISPRAAGAVEALEGSYRLEPSIDFRPLFFDKPAYFMDPVHLNNSGASEFSKAICAVSRVQCRD